MLESDVAMRNLLNHNIIQKFPSQKLHELLKFTSVFFYAGYLTQQILHGSFL